MDKGTLFFVFSGIGAAFLGMMIFIRYLQEDVDGIIDAEHVPLEADDELSSYGV